MNSQHSDNDLTDSDARIARDTILAIIIIVALVMLLIALRGPAICGGCAESLRFMNVIDQL
jgi:hypothetical protein